MTYFKNTLLNSAIKSVRGLAKKLDGDNRGVAAIEFALIAPIMISFYFGLSEISMAISADRDVTHGASVAGDLATQATELDRLDIEDIMNATIEVLNVRDADVADISIDLTSFQMVGGTRQTIGRARLGANLGAYNANSISNNMLNNTSGVVVARVRLAYSPLTFKFMSNVNLDETFLLKPRKSLAVPFNDGGSSNFTCSVSNRLVSC